MISRTIYYEARISFGIASLLPLLLLPAYVLFGGIIWLTRDQSPPYDDVVRAFTYVLPLAGGLCAAHLMSLEREIMFDDLRYSYPESPFRLALIRTLTAIIFIVISGTVSAVMFFLINGAFDLSDVLFPALPGAFYLCGMALLINNLSGNYWISAGAITAYWYGDLTSGGYFSGMLYLFNHTMPVENFDPALNHSALLAGAGAFYLLNAIYSHYRRRRIG